jgi:phage host-nuclease inhibitor protein Gam
MQRKQLIFEPTFRSRDNIGKEYKMADSDNTEALKHLGDTLREAMTRRFKPVKETLAAVDGKVDALANNMDQRFADLSRGVAEFGDTRNAVDALARHVDDQVGQIGQRVDDQLVTMAKSFDTLAAGVVKVNERPWLTLAEAQAFREAMLKDDE